MREQMTKVMTGGKGLSETNMQKNQRNYSRTSMAGTLMAHSPGLARTIIMVPIGHVRYNPPWMGRTTLG